MLSIQELFYGLLSYVWSSLSGFLSGFYNAYFWRVSQCVMICIYKLLSVCVFGVGDGIINSCKLIVIVIPPFKYNILITFS